MNNLIHNVYISIINQALQRGFYFIFTFILDMTAILEQSPLTCNFTYKSSLFNFKHNLGWEIVI